MTQVRIDRATLEQALDALNDTTGLPSTGARSFDNRIMSIMALRTALEQQAKPVAVVAETSWGYWPDKGGSLIADWTGDAPPVGTKLYTAAPAPAPKGGLSD